ncbi:MAG TPA: RDD family protein [Thermoanaerobaculia bacterium]|nr:RDD family protein [Thermoanaerobaculia bacterium]
MTSTGFTGVPTGQYAGFWRRLLAEIVDLILLLLVTAPLLTMIYGVGYWTEDQADIWSTLVRGPADFVISWILPAVLVIGFWHFKQATPGKMLVSARIVDAGTGGAPSLGQYVIRYLGYILSMIPCGLGYIWIAFDPRKQGWHDKLARTVVVVKQDR